MKRSDIFDYIQAHAPAGVQFVDPYLSTVPLPTGDFCSLNILPIEDVGLSAVRTSAYNAQTQTISQEYSQERVYTVQFDCFGDGAFDLALSIKGALKDFFYNEVNTLFRIKTVTDIENNMELQTNKKFKERFTFRMSFYVIDKRTETDQPALENVVPVLVDIAQ